MLRNPFRFAPRILKRTGYGPLVSLAQLVRGFSRCFTPRNEKTKDIPLNSNPQQIGKIPQQFMISFTCKKCNTRSSHLMSKQAYTKGTVLIECPGCKNRHLIADHLKIFSDNRITIEDILKAKGEALQIGNPNDIEFESLPESIKEKLKIKME